MRQDLQKPQTFLWGVVERLGGEAESLKQYQFPTFRLLNWGPGDPGVPMALMAASRGFGRYWLWG